MFQEAYPLKTGCIHVSGNVTSGFLSYSTDEFNKRDRLEVSAMCLMHPPIGQFLVQTYLSKRFYVFQSPFQEMSRSKRYEDKIICTF